MNEIRQYRPAFFEGFENETAQFEDLADLVEIPWVKSFATHKEFHQFSASGKQLMAEYRGGREWWVCGTLKAPVEGIPEWDGGIYECRNERGEKEDIPCTGVACSDGMSVVLRDGRVLLRWTRE